VQAKNSIKQARIIGIFIGIIVALVGVVLILSPFDMLKKTQQRKTDEPLWFVRLDQNSISTYGAKNLESNLKTLLTDAKENNSKLSIMHIGDSHIQADFFTGHTRKLLASWLNDKKFTRGFTFPYQLYGSNPPDDLKAEWKGDWQRVTDSANIGISGVAVTTSSPNGEISISVTKVDENEQLFDNAKIFFSSNSQNIIPHPTEKHKLIHRDAWSVTYKLHQPCSSITVAKPNSTNDTLTIHGINLVNSQAKLNYHAAGLNGASVKTFLKMGLFTQHLTSINPNIVIISLGTNDAYTKNFNTKQFRKDYEVLISQIDKALPDAAIILSTAGDHLFEKEHHNPNIEKANHQIVSAAKKYDCAVWDFYSVMGGKGSIELWAEDGLCAPDKLHLNRKGYKLQASLFFDALMGLTNDNRNVLTTKLEHTNE